jgi:pimeloyl-ACP methyl ester carboxylesterase
MEQKNNTVFDRVVLIHGIRTQAAWAEMVSATIRKEVVVEVTPIRYGYFDIFRFLSPIFTREKPIEKVTRELRQILKKTHQEKVLVIAHSFGTYIITRILAENPDICIGGLILCGSVVSEEYRWDINKRSVHLSRIINECGDQDIWPSFAKSVSWGYGATGRLGFGSEAIHDRFHNLDHSGFFNPEFVCNYWIPLLKDWVITDSDYSLSRGAAQWWLAPITVIPLKSLVLLTLSVLLLIYVLIPYMRVPVPVPISSSTSKSAVTILPSKEVQEKYRYSDHRVVPSLDNATQKAVITSYDQLLSVRGKLQQEQTNVVANGYFYMSVPIPESNITNEKIYHSAEVELTSKFRPNLYVSIQAKPTFSRGTIDLFGCNIAVVFQRKKQNIMFWSSEYDMTVIDIPVAINFDQYNTFALRQVDKYVSAFVNGQKLAEFSFLSSPNSCSPKLQIKAHPTKIDDSPGSFGLNFQGLAAYEFNQAPDK